MIIEELAEVYPQLYLTPGEQGAEDYKRVVLRGEDAPSHDLSHFHGSGQDSLTIEETPAGPVQTITLGDRRDFELFLQIMANKCNPVQIPKTQGASILDGVINWTKIRAHQEEFLQNGGFILDWGQEFKRFTSDKRNYTDALIVLSIGPYSAVPAAEAGLSEEEWLTASQIIRKTHECTHFICRRLYPDKIDEIKDELVADAVGLYAAFGRYDLPLAEKFLGITGHTYTGGRLENYVESDELADTVQSVCACLALIEEMIRAAGPVKPYELAVMLEEGM